MRRELVTDPDRVEKVGEVGAATHADVLTSIDELAGGGVGERTGPAAEALSRLQYGHAKARVRPAPPLPKGRHRPPPITATWFTSAAPYYKR